MKKTYWLIALLGVAVLMVPGCKRTHEDVLEDMLDTMEEMTDVLATVTDEKSAEAAKPKLEELVGQMQEIKKEMDQMEKPDKATDEALQKKYEARMQEVMGKFMKEAMRIGTDPKLSGKLSDTMKKANM